MSNDDLVAFLRARLDEDHLTAHTAEGAEWTIEDAKKTRDIELHKNPRAIGFGVWVVTGENGSDGIAETTDTAHARHIARWDPASALAEVDAKRRILAEYEHWARRNAGPSLPDGVDGGQEYGLEHAIRCLALPYAHHPDYRTDWAPGA
ncbi:DUF6221 family protein [Kitasatospora sp. NPDC004289]